MVLGALYWYDALGIFDPSYYELGVWIIFFIGLWYFTREKNPSKQ